MAQRANVPKFGDWGTEESVPDTVYFNARKTMEGRSAMETKEGNMTDRDSYHSFLAPSSAGAPGRSQRRPFRGDESHEKVADVPRFGEWNESAPQSADYRYESVRADASPEKGAPVPRFGAWDEYDERSNEPKKCCFPWW